MKNFIFFEKYPFAVVAHRGGIGHFENTLAGIKHSINIKVDMIEVDVRSTKDDTLILFHDIDFKRVSGVSKRVKDLDYEFIKDSLKVFDKEPIPTLKDALDAVDNKAVLLIEIKEPDTTDEIVKLIKKRNTASWVVLISFYEKAIKKVKMTSLDIKTGLIYKRVNKIEKAKNLGCEFVLPYYKVATPKSNIYAHSLGLKVITWTVNDKNCALNLYKNKVDAIASDYPEMLLNFRKNIEKRRA